LTATALASLAFVILIQCIFALLSIVVNGPELTLRQFVELIPLWIAGDVVMATLSLHATDLVAAGWSRVYVFGILGLFLYIQSGLNLIVEWLASLLNSLGNTLLAQNMPALASTVFDLSNWLVESGADTFGSLAGLVFWPFKAIVEGVIAGQFSLWQALAPAILLLYSCALFFLAARFFYGKDLFLTE
jgi:hypothetical protein